MPHSRGYAWMMRVEEIWPMLARSQPFHNWFCKAKLSLHNCRYSSYTRTGFSSVARPLLFCPASGTRQSSMSLREHGWWIYTPTSFVPRTTKVRGLRKSTSPSTFDSTVSPAPDSCSWLLGCDLVSRCFCWNKHQSLKF